MTDVEVNVAIAKECGAKQCPIHLGFGCCGQKVLDYATDLNAMRAAEGHLTDDEKTDYIRLLNRGDFSYRKLAFAKARERAEAFLHLRGHYKELDSNP